LDLHFGYVIPSTAEASRVEIFQNERRAATPGAEMDRRGNAAALTAAASVALVECALHFVRAELAPMGASLRSVRRGLGERGRDDILDDDVSGPRSGHRGAPYLAVATPEGLYTFTQRHVGSAGSLREEPSQRDRIRGADG
jgi:hypothetical protein